MNVLFEDEGQLKAGTVLADNEASLQVESASGKRIKVKSTSVLLRFGSPSPAEVLAAGQRIAGEVDPTFLWEVSGEDDFGFDDLAREYFGAQASPEQQAAIAMRLHGAPMHFYKRGKGRYRKAPADALRAALASVERKAREAETMAGWVAELQRRELPDALRPKLAMLLHRPDKNTLEWKALAAASEAARLTPVALLAQAGAIPSTHGFHFDRFTSEVFPKGLGFPPVAVPGVEAGLEAGPRNAFSIDDRTTTEIDDAFSVERLGDGRARIGIHIAVPGLAIARGTPVDAIARERLSTVYMPGRKITMLPEHVADAFSLRAGEPRPALSLYVEVGADGVPVAQETRVDVIEVARNLHLDEIDEAFTREPAAGEAPLAADLRVLWALARTLSERRGKAEVQRVDYSYYVDWDAPSGIGEPGRVAIVQRPRGSPLDKLIAELMIHVNNSWGKLVAEKSFAGLYRTQSMGKVRMSTRPGEHQGLGLSHYLWSSSPLRRYADLVNQRQVVAAVRGQPAPYPANDPELFAALTDFEVTYSQYAEFQDRMEHYWCLRWLLQEGSGEEAATVIRENLVRFDRLPLVMRLADLPDSAPGTPVRVAIGAIDLLAPSLECRVASVGTAAARSGASATSAGSDAREPRSPEASPAVPST